MEPTKVLGVAAVIAAGLAVTRTKAGGPPVKIPSQIVHLSKTDEEWKQSLTTQQFQVLRKEQTERAFTSPLNDNKGKGVYTCAGCDLPLWSSEHKFDSGTGWPSFWQPIAPQVIGTKTDYYLLYPRTEVHCVRCEGHQGHVFKDGPKPTGLRYCINGVALKFVPA